MYGRFERKNKCRKYMCREYFDRTIDLSIRSLLSESLEISATG